MRVTIYIQVPHLRDGLIVAKVGEAATPPLEAR